MPDPLKTVFISYRRDVASFIARSIFQNLHRYRYDVFMDVESIDSGTFDTIILRQIEARAHFIVILTPGTIERFANSDDWLRREIEHAMDKQRNVVPLLVNRFTFDGSEKYLTGKLSELPRFNGLEVPHTYFEEAMSRLRKRYLKQPVEGAIEATPAHDEPVVQQKINEAAAQSTPTDEELVAEFYSARAYSKLTSGDLDGGIADYSEAIRISPKRAQALNNRGFAYYHKGDYEAALKDCNEAVRLAPSSPDILDSRAQVFFAIGEYSLALGDFKWANRFRPNYNMALAGLAITYYRLEWTEEARRRWKALVAKDRRYLDTDWVGKELEWAQPLIDAAGELIAEHDD